MNGIRHNHYINKGMTMLCIAIFLFSYVNATMFWHGHSGSGYWVFHSHIASAAHRTAPSENPHNSAELQLIQISNQASYTEEVIACCDLEPVRMLMETVQTEPTVFAGIQSSVHIVLRGPPALV